MLNLTNKGFVLVETLITAVFVMAIFSVIYVNFYPIMAEYERRENFDDVDSKYSVYWIKRIIQSSSVSFNNGISNDIDTKKYHQFQCSDIDTNDKTTIKYCNDLINSLDISKDKNGKPSIYITKYKIGNRDNMDDKNNFKGVVEENTGSVFSSGFQDYISYLPTYSKTASLNGACYRVLIEYHHKSEDDEYWTYSTMEIIKGQERC